MVLFHMRGRVGEKCRPLMYFHALLHVPALKGGRGGQNINIFLNLLDRCSLLAHLASNINCMSWAVYILYWWNARERQGALTSAMPRLSIEVVRRDRRDCRASDFPRSRRSRGIHGIADLKRNPWNDKKNYLHHGVTARHLIKYVLLQTWLCCI